MPDDRRHEDRACQDCRCRDCDNMTAAMDRLSTYKGAREALMETKFSNEDVSVTPLDVLILANWLWNGESVLGND